MPKQLPKPFPEAHYVGEYTTFFPIKDSGIDTCDWCDTVIELTTFDANDGIFVNICKECERMARSLSRGGFSMKRSYVDGIIRKRAEQIARKNT